MTFLGINLRNSLIRHSSKLLCFLSLSCIFLKIENIYSYEQPTLSLEHIRRNKIKIDRSIDETKNKIKQVKDVNFLPQLYFALAEFLVMKSRYMIMDKTLANPKSKNLDFTKERQPQLEAIEIYDTLLEKFPHLEDKDKALFFKAHEWRELGHPDNMIKTYEQLLQECPKSDLWNESQMILGDYFFDEKKDLNLALHAYQKILQKPLSPFTALAQYKIGWVYIKQSQFNEAKRALEQALKHAPSGDFRQLPDIYRKTDIRQEALFALVWPYSETENKKVLKNTNENPLAYFYRLASNQLLYQKVLNKLSPRLSLKHRYLEAVQVDFELLRLTGDVKDRLEIIQRLIDNLHHAPNTKNAQNEQNQNSWPFPGLMQEIVKTVLQVENSTLYKPNEKKKILSSFEVLARDFIIQTHQQTKNSNQQNNWENTIQNYNTYLLLFPQSPYFHRMRLNLAESYYSHRQFAESGHEYELLTQATKNPSSLKSFFDSSIEAYTQAVHHQTELSQLQLIQARNGLREVGFRFIKLYPQDDHRPSIILNIGQTFYDERRFSQARIEFKNFISLYPHHPKVSLAANLLLDASHQQENFNSLVADGKFLLTYLTQKKIKDQKILQQIRDTVQQAELKLVQAQSGNLSSPQYATQLLKIAKKNRGSSLGAQALYEAFYTFRNQKDFRAYEAGEQLVMNHGSSEQTQEVTAALAQMALSTADYRRAALYFELFFEKYGQQPQARDFLKKAAVLRELMGDFKFAAHDYKNLDDRNSVARLDFISQDWPALLRSAPLASGIMAAYYEGLAALRLGHFSKAQESLKKVSAFKSKNPEDQEISAHALYLLSLETQDRYKNLKPNSQQKTIEKLVAEKNNLLQQLELQLQKVIELKSGKWVMASLYDLGKAYLEFAHFIKNAPLPKSLPANLNKIYLSEVAKKASIYENTAKNYFGQCVQSAEKFEILSRFTLGCQSYGNLEVDETQDYEVPSRAAEISPPSATALRHQLLLQPKNVDLYHQLAVLHAQAKDSSMGLLILHRALEINPHNAHVMAELGALYLHQKNYLQAQAWFKKALLESDRPASLAYWGLAHLFKKFGFKSKYQETLAKAQKAGPPQGWFQSLVNP